MDNVTIKMKNAFMSKDFLFFLISFILGLIISFSNFAGDDAALYELIGTTAKEWAKWSIDPYYTWTSRQFIYFISAAVLCKGRIALMLYVTVSSFVLLKAFSLLYLNNSKSSQTFIVFVLMLFPFDALMTAGWSCTITTYFGPAAFALMALVPIKKALLSEKINVMTFIFYCFCLIYGANLEQMCIVVLFCYLVAVIYFFIKKKISWQILCLFILSVLSTVYIITCPGNRNRSIHETIQWFPTYNMLDTVDKADVGLSTTFRWMFASGNILIIATCIIMAYFVWKRYNEILFRIIALLPAVMTLLLGPFLNAFSSVFPYAAYAANEVNYYGSFTVSASGIGSGMIQFGLFLIIAICIFVEICLLNDKIEGLIADVTLITSGILSRAMMGFSPTVYASNSRTYLVLVFCLMAVLIHIYTTNIEKININIHKNTYKCIMWLLIVLAFFNLIYLVATALY